MLRRLAPAKINLALHVTGQRADGFHLLDSLVSFADFGDVVSVRPAVRLGLEVVGPMAAEVPTGADNLIARAAALFAASKGAAITLEKNLPIASGIGGGSADAAAVLHLLAGMWQLPMPDSAALIGLGADIPVCLAGRPVRMRGIGEILDPFELPQFYAVLVNPGVGVLTIDIFNALKTKNNPRLAMLPHGHSHREWLDYLKAQRNDLQEPAVQILPEIGEVLDALGQCSGCELARMSGSGATCFGLFTCENLAMQAAGEIGSARPDWWMKKTRLPG